MLIILKTNLIKTKTFQVNLKKIKNTIYYRSVLDDKHG